MDKKLEKLIAEEGVSEASILQEMASKPWKQRKADVVVRKDETRSRIRNTSVPEGAVLRKPRPSTMMIIKRLRSMRGSALRVRSRYLPLRTKRNIIQKKLQRKATGIFIRFTQMRENPVHP